MKRRIAVWAGLGIVAACVWFLYGVITPQASVALALREPAVRALMFATCPAVSAIRFVPMPFWLVAVINGTTYALIGLIVETLRRKWSVGKAA